MNIKLLGTLLVGALATGCASVPMESPEKTELAKQFNSPSDDASGIYIFRKDTYVGAALKKDLWVDGDCLGQTAKGVFFYREVDGDQEHTLSTESEFSPNDLPLYAEAGELYFVEQYLKMGAFVGGADLRKVDVQEGKQEVSKLEMAESGTCSSER